MIFRRKILYPRFDLIDFRLLKVSFPRSKEKKRRKKRREERRRVRPNEGFRGVRDMVRGDGQIGGCLRGWLSVWWVMRDFEVVGERTGV